MASDKRVKVTLACEDCKRRNYITMKNKVNDRERIEMKKYCRFDRRHTLHKETRGSEPGHASGRPGRSPEYDLAALPGESYLRRHRAGAARGPADRRRQGR